MLSENEIIFRVAWRGHDLSDSIEEEGMTLAARACHHIACEIASAVRQQVEGYVPEPWQDDSWASLEFPNEGQKVRCVITLQDEKEYTLSVDCPRPLFRSLFSKKPSVVKQENLEVVRVAIDCNSRLEILSEVRDNN